MSLAYGSYTYIYVSHARSPAAPFHALTGTRTLLQLLAPVPGSDCLVVPSNGVFLLYLVDSDDPVFRCERFICKNVTTLAPYILIFKSQAYQEYQE